MDVAKRVVINSNLTSIKLPALFVLAVLFATFTLPGCVYWDARRIMPVLHDSGAKRVSVARSGKQLRYDLLSMLPGRHAPGFCAAPFPQISASPRFMLLDCAGNTSDIRERLLHSFERAASTLHGYFPGTSIARVRAVLVPDGVRHILRSRGRSRPDALELSLAFRSPGNRETYMRSAITEFAHEYTHVALASGDEMTAAREEYLAGIAESCVEQAVFGDTKGYVFAESFTVSGSFNRQQRISAQSFNAAYADVSRFKAGHPSIGAGPRGEAFARFCERALRMKANPP